MTIIAIAVTRIVCVLACDEFSQLPVFPATSFRCYQFSPLPVFAATSFRALSFPAMSFRATGFLLSLFQCLIVFSVFWIFHKVVNQWLLVICTEFRLISYHMLKSTKQFLRKIRTDKQKADFLMFFFQFFQCFKFVVLLS